MSPIRVTDLEVHEVSLVDDPAVVKAKFLLVQKATERGQALLSTLHAAFTKFEQSIAQVLTESGVATEKEVSKQMNLDEIKAKDPSALSDEERGFLKQNEDKLTDEEKVKFGLTQKSDDNAELTQAKEEVTKLSTKVEEQAKEIEELKGKATTAEEKAGKTAELEQKVTDLSKEIEEIKKAKGTSATNGEEVTQEKPNVWTKEGSPFGA